MSIMQTMSLTNNDSGKPDPTRNVQTVSRQRAIAEGAYFDPTFPEKVKKFFAQHLTISRGRKANERFNLLPWQEQIISELYGYRNQSGRMLCKECLITTGKKQGKSALISGVSLAQLLLTEEMSPLIVVGASCRKQASEIFEDIDFSINANPKLKKVLHSTPSTKTVRYKNRNGRIQIISAEAQNHGGLDCSCVILDELALHPNEKLYEMLRYSMTARENPLMILLSNAGWDRTHFYWRLYSKAKAIIEGTDDDPYFFPFVHEIPESADWTDENFWTLANPSLGTVMSIEDMRSDCERAKKDKAEEAIFRRWRCNQWMKNRETYISLADWDACKKAEPDLNKLNCFVAVDLSSTTDLTGIVACYPIGDSVYTKCWAFVPRASLKRNTQNSELYRQFADEKSLTFIEGNCMDYSIVRDCIKKIPGKIETIYFDKSNALETSLELMKSGYKVFNMPQYPSYFNEPMKKLNSLIMDRKIHHDGNSCLRWCINNLQAKIDHQNRLYPVKGSEHLKIDCAVALIMSIAGTLTKTNYQKKISVYETRGLRTI